MGRRGRGGCIRSVHVCTCTVNLSTSRYMYMYEDLFFPLSHPPNNQVEQIANVVCLFFYEPFMNLSTYMCTHEVTYIVYGQASALIR